ncbi:MAG: hypothetical protein HW387_1714 [Parachlamydiales bacterium]|nr:hypothetical protein [Parachlamydiales bacterium]
MTLEPKVNLEVYWQGDYSWHGWDIWVIDLKIPESPFDVFANIDATLPSSQKQQLNFSMSRRDVFCFDPNWTPDETSSCFNAPIDLIKTLEISARIFQTYESRPSMRCQPNSALRPTKCSRQDDLPIFIEQRPDFQPTQTYQIKIVHQNDTLLATIEQKARDLASQDSSQSTSSTSEMEL